jgi:glycine/D-amino acid oxidase-like deaminating enzyme
LGGLGAKDVLLLLPLSGGSEGDSMLLCFGAHKRPALQRNHINEPPMIRIKRAVAVKTPVTSALQICKASLQQNYKYISTPLFEKNVLYWGVYQLFNAEWNRSRDAYPKVFPEVGVDMRSEDIASTLQVAKQVKEARD